MRTLITTTARSLLRGAAEDIYTQRALIRLFSQLVVLRTLRKRLNSHHTNAPANSYHLLKPYAADLDALIVSPNFKTDPYES